MYPTDVRYTRDHGWARKGSDGTLTVGITDWATRQLGEIVFVELPELGSDLSTGEPFGTVESVKAVSELYLPVDGTITAVNEVLNDSPEVVNGDPYGEGWFITLRPSDAKAYDELMTAAQYDAFVKDED